MTMKDFLEYIANKQHVSPVDELQKAACAALLGYGVIKVASKKDNHTYYGLKDNVDAFGEDGKYVYRVLPTEENKGKGRIVEIDAREGKFSSSTLPLKEDELTK